jgi:hypothetical protein
VRHHPTESIAIDAPLATVWAVMLDKPSYAEWNPFVVRAECPSPPEVGDPIVLHVRLATSGSGHGSYRHRLTRSPERISAIEPPTTDADSITTACPERVAEGFRRHAAGLKQRAEELARS